MASCTISVVSIIAVLLVTPLAGNLKNKTISLVESQLIDFLFDQSSQNTLTSLPRCKSHTKELTAHELESFHSGLRKINKSSLDVSVELFIVYLGGVIEKDQVVSLSLFFEASWIDCRLHWDIEQFPVKSLFISATDVTEVSNIACKITAECIAVVRLKRLFKLTLIGIRLIACHFARKEEMNHAIASAINRTSSQYDSRDCKAMSSRKESLRSSHNIFIPSLVILEQIEPQTPIAEGAYLAIEPHRVTMGTVLMGKFLCDIDVTLYPFDTQACTLTVGTVDDFLRQVNLTEEGACNGTCSSSLMHVSDQIQIDTWDIYVSEVKWSKHNVKPCDSSQLKDPKMDQDANCYAAQLAHKVVLRRHPTFQLLNLFFPVAISVILSSFVFLMPPGKGDKMELSLTILLSLFVYSQIVYQSLPDTGGTMPLISQYVIVCIYMVGFSCIVSVVGDMLDARAVHVPGFLVRIIMVHVGPIILPSYFKKYKERRTLRRAQKHNHSVDSCAQEKEDVQPHCLQAVVTDSKQNVERDEDWRLLAAVFDRCFFYMHLASSIAVFLIFMIYGFYCWTNFKGRHTNP